jgi:hypothetical protein
MPTLAQAEPGNRCRPTAPVADAVSLFLHPSDPLQAHWRRLGDTPIPRQKTPLPDGSPLDSLELKLESGPPHGRVRLEGAWTHNLHVTLRSGSTVLPPNLARLVVPKAALSPSLWPV